MLRHTLWKEIAAMEDDNILTKGIDALYTMKENLLELEGYKSQNSELAMKEDQLEKQIEYKEKLLAEEVEIAVKKRRLEVEATFDEQIDKVKARIKKVKSKKDKEKNVQISERILEETSDLRKERISLKEEMKAIYQNNNIPQILNNSFYHALFMPRSLKDIGTIILTLLVVLFIFPYLMVYKLLLPETTFNLVMVYIITVLLFGGLYLLINSKTKTNHFNAIIDIRSIRAKQIKNQKRINSKAREIRRDKDESVYLLQKFDEELTELEDQIKSITQEKKDVMVEFETKTIGIIDGEVRGSKKDEMNSLKENHRKVYEEQRKVEEKIKMFSLEIANEYEKFVGKEMMSIAVIDNLIQIIQSEEANTVAEAIAILKKNGQVIS